MAKGISVHIGVNRVNPQHYQDSNGNPWEGKLIACEADALAMESLAKEQGFETQTYLTEQATSHDVIYALQAAAQVLQEGDLFFLSYAGHGGQVPDCNGGQADEEDHKDETWCLYDRQLIDDELYRLWSLFKPGVRILVLSDSCHSGSAVRNLLPLSDLPSDEPGVRTLPPAIEEATYRSHQVAYDKLQAENPAGDTVDVSASVILISGCQDNQLSLDGKTNGLFTATLLRVWNSGKFQGSLTRFWKKIVANMPYYQSPNLFKTGASNPVFERQRPFTI